MTQPDSIFWEPHDRHWIRLRGPWEVRGVEAQGATNPPRRVILPSEWRALFGDCGGTAEFARTFQRPTNLDHDERVCVTLTNVNAEVRCRLNNVAVPALPQPLGAASCWPSADCVSFDVTDCLQETNRLVLILTLREAPTRPTGLHEPVLIEIVSVDSELC